MMTQSTSIGGPFTKSIELLEGVTLVEKKGTKKRNILTKAAESR